MSTSFLSTARDQPVTSALQGTFDDLGTPLAAVTFVVVDLETTGGSPVDAGITEIGAVKIRGGQVLGEFATLVDPGIPIPAFIAVLTGITDRMLTTAPRLPAALAAFLEFAQGTVLVAHNAPYDMGFLKGACAKTDQQWINPVVIDTARLARAVLLRDEVANCKLGTLATHFRSATTPDHRALTDARATVDVLHGLLERVGALGVHSLEELATYTSRVSPAQRRKRHLADDLPDEPGVYIFRDDRGRALYIGKSRHIRSRVRTYFTASEKRTRMAQMVALAACVTPLICASDLEAQVRELRLIAEHKPRFNRRSRHPERACWVKLTAEAFPRLSQVRIVRDDAGAGAAYLGPFGSKHAAEQAIEALQAVIPLRTCTSKLSPRRLTSPCVLAELGRCPAPCAGEISVEGYAELVTLAREAMTGDIRHLHQGLWTRLKSLSDQQRYEDAAMWRDRLESFARAASRAQELAELAAIPELVAASATSSGGWEIHVVRHGRLAGAGLAASNTDPKLTVEALLAMGERVEPAAGPVPAALPSETELILRWLAMPGVRLVRLRHSGDPGRGWALPAFGAGGLVAVLGQKSTSSPVPGWATPALGSGTWSPRSSSSVPTSTPSTPLRRPLPVSMA